MRLSTNLIFSLQMQSISKSQSAWLASGMQVSTGKRVTKPSDDPIAASQALNILQTQTKDAQYAMAQSFAGQSLSNEENALGNVSDNLQSALTQIIYGTTGTLNDDDRAVIATQLQNIRDQLVNLANTQDSNGRYIFAGYKTQQPPFVSGDDGVTYQGGDQAITQQVDAQRTMTIGHPGDSVFMSHTGNAIPEPDGSASETNVFTLLDEAITALKTPQDGQGDEALKQFEETMGKVNRGLHNSLNNVLSVRSEIGTQLAELDTLGDQRQNRQVILSDQLSQLTDIDITESISRYVMQQTALQASYKTFSQITQLSLFQLNR
mgnify:CR=1 FL=1